MDDNQAAEALFNAVAEDTGRTTEYDAGIGAAPAQPATPESKQEAPVVTPTEGEAQQENAAPTEAAAEATATEEADSFTNLDPTTIPEHLQPWYKQMQADYTRKTQALAEQRKSFEQLGAADPTELQAAHTLFSNLQDPQFALRFYETLGGTLAQAGLTPAQQQAVVAAQQSNPAMHQQAQLQAQQISLGDDPETYFHSKINELESRYDEMRQSLAQEREQAQREQFQLALAGEVARQEEFLKETNPHWKDADWEAVYKMADAFGGNLIEASNLYEQAVTNRVNTLIQSKEAVSTTHAATSGIAAGSSQTAPTFGDDLDAAHVAAQEALRQMMAAG